MIKGICSNCGKERFLRDNLYCNPCIDSIRAKIKQTHHEIESGIFFTKQESDMFLYGKQ